MYGALLFYCVIKLLCFALKFCIGSIKKKKNVNNVHFALKLTGIIKL